jgi:hypothetical protein
VLTVLAHLIERGDYDELHEIIKRQGPQIARIQARRPRAGGIERGRRRYCLGRIAGRSA